MSPAGRSTLLVFGESNLASVESLQTISSLLLSPLVFHQSLY